MKLHTRITPWLPRMALAFGVVCVGSGLVLAFQFHPWGDVFARVESITTRIPFGWFFRRLHFLSGEACVVLTLLHVLDHFLRRNHRVVPLTEWARLWLASALALLILFTGFVLKGDKEGILAGTILQNLSSSVPLAGEALARLLIGTGQDFFFPPYLWHCWLLPLVLGYLLRNHIRSWLPQTRYMTSGLLASALGALMIPMPLALPPGAAIEEAFGPWFFLGLQEMLKHLPPLWAGVVLPGCAAALFLGLPLMSGRAEQAARLTFLGALGAYTVLTGLVLVQRGF
jgi:ubiquinol-cytochrome c reductase cytochrome b subunit